MTYLTIEEYIVQFGPSEVESAKKKYDGIAIEWDDIRDSGMNARLEIPWRQIEHGADITVTLPRLQTGGMDRFLDNFEIDVSDDET